MNSSVFSQIRIISISKLENDISFSTYSIWFIWKIKKLYKLRLIKTTTTALFFEHPMINNIDYNREEHLFLPSRYMHQSWDEYGEGFRDKIGGRWPRYYRLRVSVRARWRLLLYRLRFPPLDRLMIRSFHRRCCTWHSRPHHSQPHDARPLAPFRFDIDKWEHSHIAKKSLYDDILIIL